MGATMPDLHREDEPRQEDEPVRVSALKRLILLTATTLVSVNIWTGAPLLALWVGSRVVGRRSLTMGSVLLVVVLLVVFVTSMAVALTWLSARYDRLTGWELEGGRSRLSGSSRTGRRGWFRPRRSRSIRRPSCRRP